MGTVDVDIFLPSHHAVVIEGRLDYCEKSELRRERLDVHSSR
jgi:hypothetical protein